MEVLRFWSDFRYFHLHISNRNNDKNVILKDRQQELRPVLVASQYIEHYHVPLGCQYM